MIRTLRHEMRVVWRVAMADLLRWVRVPSLIAATLIPAAGMALTVLGLTYAVGRQPVALVQLDHSPAANDVVASIKASDGFFLVHRTAAQADKDLRAQKVAGIVTIPDGFEEAVAAQQAKIDVVINNVDLDFSDDIRRSVSEAAVTATLGKPPADEAAEGETGFGEPGQYNPYHVGMIENDLRQGDTKFLDYQLVPVLALLALTTGALVTALAITGDRETGVLRMASLAPVTRDNLVLGRLLGGTLASSLVVLGVSLPLARLGWLHPPPGRWPLVALVLFLTSVGATGLGVLIGVVTRRVATTALVGVNAVAASFLLGGGFTTVAFLPGWVQKVAHAAPTFYSVDALRQAMFYKTTPNVPFDLMVLGLAAGASLAVGALVLSRTSGRPA